MKKTSAQSKPPSTLALPAAAALGGAAAIIAMMAMAGTWFIVFREYYKMIITGDRIEYTKSRGVL